MVTLKKSLNLLAVMLFAITPVCSFAQQSVETGVVTTSEINVQDEHATVEKTQDEKVAEFIEHHLKDDYSYVFFSDEAEGKNYGVPLPVILIDNGLKVFMSSEFEYGEKLVEKDGQTYRLYHSKIYKTDAAGTIIYDEKGYPSNEKPLDFSITKNVVGLLLATLLLFLGFMALARTYKNGPNNLPKGIARVLEPLVLYVRDEMAIPNIGIQKYRKFMPYLLTVFFLIFLLNLLGLTPLGLNVTGNISVTFCLAIFTFLITCFAGNKNYWKHIFWMPGVPVPMKIVLAPIEVIGMITKPFSLMIRLFANITAGHSIMMGIIAVIFLMKESLGTAGATSISLALSVFIMFLELLIAFLQAFIFTMLSSLFIGMAVQEEDAH